MFHRRLAVFAGLLVCLATGTAFAEGFNAKSYHDSNCMRCHGTEVYTREDRRIRSFSALESQVARCDSMLETKLFPEDLAQLVEHLNTNFYQFSN
jgi:hypothetical protein